jgi:hypothetical protein
MAQGTEASMANLYFEELETGIRSVAGPYLLSRDEISELLLRTPASPTLLGFDQSSRVLLS